MKLLDESYRNNYHVILNNSWILRWKNLADNRVDLAIEEPLNNPYLSFRIQLLSPSADSEEWRNVDYVPGKLSNYECNQRVQRSPKQNPSSDSYQPATPHHHWYKHDNNRNRDCRHPPNRHPERSDLRHYHSLSRYSWYPTD